MTEQFELSRRTALAGIGSIGVASAGAGLGTSAYFSDQGAFDGGELIAGELDVRIDWQQLYFGPEENTDRYEPYGDAGYPFVNAHPDHNTDGMQSLDLSEVDEGEFADRDEIVTYLDAVDDPEDGSNIQEYLTCITLENFEVPDDFKNGVRTQESLIELDDLKPGDCGEITFSLHLCDNPGYLWVLGERGEYDEELAEAVKVRAWYDIECTNTLEDEQGDRKLIESTSLDTFLEDRLSPGRRLSPDPYGAGIITDSLEDEMGNGDEDVCLLLDEIAFEDDEIVVDGSGELIEQRVVERVEDGQLRDQLAFILLLSDEIEEISVVLQVSQLEQNVNDGTEILREESGYEGEIVEFDWDILPSYESTDGETFVSNDVGICQTGLRTNESDFVLLPTEQCTTGQTNVTSPTDASDGRLAPFSAVEFYYCADTDVPGMSLCFPEDETFCVGIEWCVPTDVGNEIQNQSASFDLGFYTEQCRHNPDPGDPPGL